MSRREQILAGAGSRSGVSLRLRLTLVGLVLALGFWTLSSTASISKSAAPRTPPVAIERRGAPPRVVLMFIDSLSRDIATNAERMPVLARLASEGTSFEVEPCRDQLTYLCLRAALTGHDDSSLLAIGDNFRPSHDGPPETLLSALAQRRGRVVVVGSPDFHPYRRSLFAEHELSKQDETPERILAAYRAAAGSDAQLVILSLTTGDMTAHAHGVGSPEYSAAFQRLDTAVGAVARALEPGTSLVVFGDHGHDAQGRHLPGTPSKTWAVYHGPAFRSGVAASMRLTDHRALLGVLFGLPTEAIYRGPPLSSVFEPAWVAQALPQGLPRLAAPSARDPGKPALRWLSMLGIALAGVGASWLVFSSHPRRGSLVALAAAAALLAGLVGLGFDQIRTLVHDHGGDAWRGLCLLVPLALAGVAAWLVRRARLLGDERLPGWLRTTAVAAALVTLFLMLPTAYYYGSRRAIVLAGSVAIALMLVDYWRRAVPTRERALPVLGLLFTTAVLLSFYPVKQLGPETGGASAWALDAGVYHGTAWLTLIAAKLALFLLLMLPRTSSQRLDSVLAGALLLLCAWVELGGLHLPRAVYGAAFAVLLVAALSGAFRRAPSSLLALSLLLLDHLYAAHAAHLAPIEILLAATAAALLAWQRLRLSETALKVATGTTVAVGVYLMFWPTVGFHLVGIDFQYMFQWVPVESYEKSWQLIALGVIAKLALPLMLVVAVAGDRLRDRTTALVTLWVLAAKVALISVMIAGYSLWHDLTSQVALAMLAELALLMFGTCAAAAALPGRRSLVEADAAALTSSTSSMPVRQ
jgi:hypothetical protein